MKIFTPVTFKNLTVQNRIARSATNDYMGNLDGTVNLQQIKIYEELAEYGVGLIFTGHYTVMQGGRNDVHQNGLWDDHFIEGHLALTQTVHHYSSKVVAQINHSGAKSPKDVISGCPVAPSAVEVVSGVLPHALSEQEILTIEDAFAAAAFRAKKAGYDGVQVHCAHGYLFSQFLDPAYNKRQDQYGGNAENRFRIVAETIAKIQDICGIEYPIFIKMHVNAIEQDAQYEQDSIYFLQKAYELGITAAELSGCDFAKKKPEERLYYLERAAKLQKQTQLPYILVGGIRTLSEMETVLKTGIAMIAMSRPFICQPDIVERLQKGENSACLGCFGCFQSFQKTGKRCVLHSGIL